MTDENEPIGRSKTAAMGAVLEARDRVVTDNEDLVSDVLSAGVMQEVFDAAWRHQFEEVRSAAKSDMRTLIKDAIDEVLMRNSAS